MEEEKLNAIRKILDFNSKIIFNGIYNKKISQESIEEIKKECLKIRDIYNFNLDCDNIELFRQIADFSKKI